MNEAELLFSRVLGLSRTELYLNRKAALGKEAGLEVSRVLKRRMSSEPLAYILGDVEFMGLEFVVTPDVLVPRQETELLLEEALSTAQRLDHSSLKVLDLGTGSGCIAVSLAKFLPAVSVDAVDISAGALELARRNALRQAVRVNFMRGDLFATTGIAPGGYDLIVSNPPYVARSEMESLPAEVKYEPRLALEAGEEGLDFYRRISREAGGYLKAGGCLVLELGFGQCRRVEDIFAAEGFTALKVIRDYQGIERVITLGRKV